MVHFQGNEYRAHTSCMTEDQKYQGALYKNKKVKFDRTASTEEATFATPTPIPKTPKTPANMAAAVHHSSQASHPHNAYVEDVAEDVNNYLIPDDASDDDDDTPPHAPTPPLAVEAPVNVFDFLVASTGTTPNASNMNLARAAAAKLSDNTQVVPYDNDYDVNDVNAYLDADVMDATDVKMTPYPVADRMSRGAPFQTPAPLQRTERRRKETSSDKTLAKDKKRKRLYLDIHDQVMTDAPPVLHSGLTGGLNRLSTKQSAAFPPSPESAETPASPLKKSKHVKHSKVRSEMATGLFSVLGAKPKSKKRRQRSASPSDKKHKHSKHERDEHKDKKHSKRSKHDNSDKKAATSTSGQKLLEFPSAKEEENKGQIIVYKPRADLFLSFVNKGPDSERGCSMNKALKRFHRERASSGKGHGKQLEEKELFRSLRLRKNDRGEIVVFCVDE